LVTILQRGYVRLLTPIVRKPVAAYAAVGLLVAGGIVVYPRLGQELLPDFKERDFLMHWVTAPGTSHDEEVRISTAACVELRTIPGVQNCGSHIGQALLADEVVGIDFGENWISVSPDVDYVKTHDAIQSVVEGYPGLRRDVQTYLKERIREVLTGSSDAIVVRIFGPDLDVLDAKAKELEEAMKAIPGTKDVHRQLQTQIAQVQVEVDLAKAQAYGIKPGDVRRAASVMLSSEEVGDVFFGGAAYDVHVWTTPSVRQNLTDIELLPIDTPVRGKVPLGELASVKVAPAPNSVTHENLTRRIDVDANVTGRDLGSVVRDVQAAVDKIQFDEGYHPEMLGEYAERQAATDRLMLFALAALVGIFLLLQASFNDTRLALLAFLTLPSALVGGILAAWATGGVLSLGSIVGFFTVLGIAARNGIMMINHFQHLERFEGEPFGPGLVLRGARERLSPILMTALATGLALVPLAIAGDLPGHEIEHPMAIVILGGLVTSTLLNLLIVPSLYLRFGKGRVQPPAAETEAVPVTA
jgi:Cu/Ag efflux pump CusA